MSKYPGRIVTDLAPAGYSVFFDGSGDWLETPNNSTLALGSSDFSVEWWEYRTTLGAEDVAIGATGTYGFIFNYYDAGFPRFFLSTSSGSWNVFNNAATGAISANTWNHFVVTRSGTAFRVFLNGVLSIYATGSGSVVQPNNNFIISGNATQSYFPGYISNVRVVKGSIPTPYQTSSTTTSTTVFTPPTQVLNSTDTILLTCNSPAIIDQSNNAFAITTNGNAAVSTLTPFRAYVPYNPALGASTPGVWTLDEALQAKGTRQWNMYDPSFNLTTLLLHGNGTNGAQNNTFLDSSSNNFTITRNGNTTQGTFSPFSQTGWSNFFDGTGDYLSVADNTALDMGSSDFTIEFWTYLVGTPSTYQAYFAKRANTGVYGGVELYLTSGRTLNLQATLNGSSWGVDITTTSTVPLNTWTHIAAVRNGNTWVVYVNGTAGATSGTVSGTVPDNANAFVIGAGASDGGHVMVASYISNFRVVKGTALYTAAFTPPTAPLTAITNTSLLTCQSNRFIDNSSNAFTITRNGDVSIQAFSPFYPTAAYTPQTIGGSGYFDGTGDYLTWSGSSIGTNTFIAECWFYLTSTAFSAQYGLFGASTTNGFGLRLINTTTANVDWLDVAAQSFTLPATLVVGNWYHIAAVRNSSNQTTVFLNGVRSTSGAVSVTTNFSGSTSAIGLAAANANYGPMFGYIASARLIIGGTPIYDPTQTTITVPTAPLTAITNTSLLLNFTNAGIVDSTAKNVLETVGNAQISTTQSKFGGSSIAFDGTGDNLLTTPTQLLNFGASDFTIEFWINPASTSAGSVLYSTSSRTKTDVLALILSGGSLLVFITASGGGAWSLTNASNAGALTTNTWQHVALVRNGSSFRGYVNGVLGFTVTSSAAVAAMDGFSIGSNGASADYLNGYLDDIRITRFARYTAAFTPQTSQWQDE